MNDELSDDIKKKFMLPLTIELQDHKEKLFITPQSPLSFPSDICESEISTFFQPDLMETIQGHFYDVLNRHLMCISTNDLPNSGPLLLINIEMSFT